MKRLAFSALCLLACSSVSFAFDNPPDDAGARYCYGYAMVGFDSVINSKLGVPPEGLVGLARIDPLVVGSHGNYAEFVLKVVFGAYIWDGSPHDYAVRVFYHCAKDQAHLLNASTD